MPATCLASHGGVDTAPQTNRTCRDSHDINHFYQKRNQNSVLFRPIRGVSCMFVREFHVGVCRVKLVRVVTSVCLPCSCSAHIRITKVKG